ncbi:hypothetical protein ZIOFF_033238 [Zingiber officinale]|uniref:Uncharacterized protein n=1 Tax=Zingiber officinale TaxID=94328 RepID=A0A8J5GQA0_ZINOF|nr:hypothetical protein ZIOFF_033238 [Zingiber officinale]
MYPPLENTGAHYFEARPIIVTASDLHPLPVFTLDDRTDFIPEADLLPPSQLSPIGARSWGQKGSLSPSPSYSSSSCFLPTRAMEMDGAGPFDRRGKNPKGLSWMISPVDKSRESYADRGSPVDGVVEPGPLIVLLSSPPRDFLGMVDGLDVDDEGF